MVALMRKELETVTSPLDIEDWTSRVSLDIIGEAGFGSKFNSLTDPDASVNKSYRAAFTVDESSRPLFLLSAITTPALVNMLPLQKVRDKIAGKAAISAWVTSLIGKRKAAMLGDDGYLEKGGHKDLISTVMKTNTMNTAGLVEQSKTFLGAGHGNLDPTHASPVAILTLHQKPAFESPKSSSIQTTNHSIGNRSHLDPSRSFPTGKPTHPATSPGRNPHLPSLPVVRHSRDCRNAR